MITLPVFVVIVASVIVVYVAANTYVSGSLRSFTAAEAMLGRVNENLEKLVESNVPVGVARVGFMLAAAAGCGCFVRSVLFSHYMPASLARLIFGGPRRDDPAVEHDLSELDKLDSKQRSLFSDLIASVIAYDGYLNPLSGWAFRRAMKAQETPSYTERADAELTAVSILSRKKSEKLPARAKELCAA